MSEHTARLGLPLIAAAQAQKHVTHNEALFEIDAILHLHVESKGDNTPPTSPSAGARYIVGANPTGAWSGKAGQVACWDDGAWRFLVPGKGWLASVGGTATLEIFDGAVWRPAFIQDQLNVTTLGVNMAPDATNAVAMRVNNMLVTARTSAQGGDGDIRLKLNKETTSDTASLLLQNGFSGRGEIGLAGDDALTIRVSSNGSTWRNALRIDHVSAEAAFPGGLAPGHRCPNLLINGDFAIRQRGGALGTVAAGIVAFDRWRTGASGATLAQTGQLVTLSAGSIQQVIEPRVFGFESFASQRLTLSVQALTGADLTITIAGQTAQILRTAQPLAATVLLPAGATGNVTVVVAPNGGAATFRQMRLEVGDLATGWMARSVPEEFALCARYFRKSYPTASAPGTALGGPGGGALGTVATSVGLYFVNTLFAAPMRATPTITLFNPVTGVAGSWRTGGGSPTVPAVDTHDAGVTFVGSGVEAGTLVFGHFTADAEL